MLYGVKREFEVCNLELPANRQVLREWYAGFNGKCSVAGDSSGASQEEVDFRVKSPGIPAISVSAEEPPVKQLPYRQEVRSIGMVRGC